MSFEIIEDMEESEYHRDPRMSSSKLKTLVLQTPAHYKFKLDQGYKEDEQKQTLILGKAIHSVILQDWDFDNKFCVLPEGLDRRTKEGKALYADILESGKQPLSSKDFEACKSWLINAENSVFWQSILRNNPKFEISMFDDNERIRLDALVYPCDDYPTGVIVDIKSCANGSVRGFGKASFDLGYDVQAAFYTDFVKRNLGFEPEFFMLAMEKSEPYIITDYQFDELALYVGRKRVSSARKILEECQQTGDWYGYTKGFQAVELPGYAFDDEDQEIYIGDGE